MYSAWIPVVFPSNERNVIQVKNAFLSQFYTPFEINSPFGYGVSQSDGQHVSSAKRATVFVIDRIRLDSIANNCRIMAQVHLTEIGASMNTARDILGDQYHYYVSPTYEYDEKNDILTIHRMDIYYTENSFQYFKG